MNRRARSNRSLSDERLAMAWHSAAVLIAPPDQALLDQLDSVHRASHLLPDEVGGPLRATVVHLEQASLAELRDEHAQTFGGPSLTLGGSPDDLRELLERAAHDASSGRALLLDRGTELERLRDSLLVAESGWAGAVAAVTASIGLRSSPPGRSTSSSWSGE